MDCSEGRAGAAAATAVSFWGDELFDVDCVLITYHTNSSYIPYDVYGMIQYGVAVHVHVNILGSGSFPFSFVLLPPLYLCILPISFWVKSDTTRPVAPLRTLYMYTRETETMQSFFPFVFRSRFWIPVRYPHSYSYMYTVDCSTII